jgi:hypothetical protein
MDNTRIGGMWLVFLLFVHCDAVINNYTGHHHHKHQGLGHLARSVSRVIAVLSSVSSVSQPFSFLVGCSGMISKGFCFVAFFEGVKARYGSYL